jgi:hypothetical protein
MRMGVLNIDILEMRPAMAQSAIGDVFLEARRGFLASNSERRCFVPSQGMYKFILGPNWGPWLRIRAIGALPPLSSYQPQS